MESLDGDDVEIDPEIPLEFEPVRSPSGLVLGPSSVIAVDGVIVTESMGITAVSIAEIIHRGLVEIEALEGVDVGDRSENRIVFRLELVICGGAE